MTFQEHWLVVCRATPQLAGDDSVKMTVSVATFKKALRRAFEAGRGTDESQRRAAKAFGDLGRKSSSFEDLFGGVFW